MDPCWSRNKSHLIQNVGSMSCLLDYKRFKAGKISHWVKTRHLPQRNICLWLRGWCIPILEILINNKNKYCCLFPTSPGCWSLSQMWYWVHRFSSALSFVGGRQLLLADKDQEGWQRRKWTRDVRENRKKEELMEENELVEIFWSADSEGLIPSAFHFTIWH